MQTQGLWIQPESLGVHPSFKRLRCPLGPDEESGCTFGAQIASRLAEDRPAEGDC
jgi:hypothetical protein